MKKTLTANISGTVFHVEEDAYEKLQRYLGNIRAQFTGSEGRDEIMADIEARIVELFTERLQGRQVVSILDVDHVITVMGQPEDFADGTAEDPAPEAASEQSNNSAKNHRRFFRDMDDKWVGGVLSGLAAYIGMDALWLRIIALILLIPLSVGALIPVYLILWTLVPKAESAADRLQMRGEAVTVDNIKRVVEEGTERVKQSGERFASEAGKLGKDWGQRARNGSSRAGEVFAKLIGVFLTLVAFGLLFSLVSAVIGGTISIWSVTSTGGNAGLMDLGELFFPSKSHALWFGIGVFTLLVVPIIALFLAGFRLLLDTRSPKWLGWSLAGIWLLAFIPTTWAGVELGMDLKRKNSTVTEIELYQPTSGTLYLDAMATTDDIGDWSMNFDDGDFDIDLDGLHLVDGMVHGGWGQLDIDPSADTLFHLKVKRQAHGKSPKSALTRAKSIAFNYVQEGDVLLVSPVISFKAEDKFRFQDVHFTLEVPLGKSVFLRPGSKAVIYDIDNVKGTLDRDMLGRTWTMTSRGLEDLGGAAPSLEAPSIAPADTIRVNGPIAAVVYHGPSKKKEADKRTGTAFQPSRANAPMTAHTKKTNLVPNVLAMLVGRPI